MDEPSFYCLCRTTHVLTGAKWIGILGIGGCAAGLFCAGLVPSFPLALLCLASIPFHISLLFAHHEHKPWLYTPFLVANGVQCVLTATYCVFICAMLVWMPAFWRRHLVLSLDEGDPNGPLSGKGGENEMRRITAILLGALVLLDLLLCWAQLIVSRAYSYMCEEQITLIPPQLSPTFVLKKDEKMMMKMPRESQLA